jgi:uncharacterized protein
MDKFSETAKAALKYYVYRLVDPRNGETFYVGKGKDDRVFQHLKFAIDASDEDASSLKVQRINVIRASGLEPIHVIHRHGMEEAQAFEVEAALMEAYPGLSNAQSGHDSAARGSAHSTQIEFLYNAPELSTKEPCILIVVNKSFDGDESLYEATRGNWRLSLTKASKAKYALAVVRGVVIGAFQIKSWHNGTPEGRFYFEGSPVDNTIGQTLVRHRLPDGFRKRGAANPIRYLNIE